MKQRFFRYYSTQRPVDIGTYPKSAGTPIRIHNYDNRTRIEPWGFLAWGYLEYAAPLDARQADDYELKPSPENPDVKEKMSKQAQVVGEWEKKHRVPETRRLTWWYPDFGEFIPKEFVTPEQLEKCYNALTKRNEVA